MKQSMLAKSGTRKNTDIFYTTSKTAVSDEKQAKTVFSAKRTITAPDILPVRGLQENRRQKMDGLKMLNTLPEESIPLAFFDPQYRSVLDKQKYGNEGKRQKGRAEMQQMDNKKINQFILAIEQALMPSGHLALWVDKYILCNGREFLDDVGLKLVDMITWNKERMGMGYRTRRYSEFLLIYQKQPVRAKGVWMIRNIPDVWNEKIESKKHTHQKPLGLQQRIIEAVTNENDIVIDPAAGSYSVMDASIETGRNFLGCDILE